MRCEAMKDNIVLIGMPGAGKSTVGVILAKLLGYEFLDSDLCIQKAEGMLLKDIIAKKGVDGFIETEDYVNSKIDVKRTVIATGGSVVYGKNAMENLSRIGEIVYLRLSFDTIDSRLTNIKGRGVVLKEGQDLKALYEERTPLYEKYADIIVDTDGLSIDETMEKIKFIIENA